MEYKDLIFTLQKALSLQYLKARYERVEKQYPTKGDVIAALNLLMIYGKESDTYKYWDEKQTIADKIAMGRL